MEDDITKPSGASENAPVGVPQPLPKQPPLPPLPGSEEQSENESQTITENRSFNKDSFLASAIHSWDALARTLCLATFVTLLLAALAWYVMSELLPKFADKIEIGEGGHFMLILKDGRTVSTVLAPAYQLAVPTGIVIKKDHDIRISADGLVLTIGGLVYLPTNGLSSVSNEVTRKFLAASLDRDSNPSWRLPDGELYYARPEFRAGETRSDLDAQKLRPDLDYGCLLAFIVPAGTKYPEEVMRMMSSASTKFLKIGCSNRIIFNHLNGRFNLDGDPNEYDFQEGDEVYLTINDVLVRDSSQIRLMAKEVAELETNRDSTRLEELNIRAAFLAAQREICDRTLNQPYGIWYLDNRGSFTVTLEQTLKKD